MVLINCKTCGKEKKIANDRLKAKNYCSKTCAGFARHQRVESNCLNCGKLTKTVLSAFKKAKTGIFCDHTCLKAYQVGKKNPKHKSNLIRNCVVCEKEIVNPRHDRKCCSKQCFGLSIQREKHSNWKDGISFKIYPPDFSQSLRKQIRERDNYTCQCCMVTQQTLLDQNKKLLTVHHIDSDRKNNNPNNLITVCQKCNNGAKKNKACWVYFYKFKIEEVKNGGIALHHD